MGLAQDRVSCWVSGWLVIQMGRHNWSDWRFIVCLSGRKRSFNVGGCFEQTILISRARMTPFISHITRPFQQILPNQVIGNRLTVVAQRTWSPPIRGIACYGGRFRTSCGAASLAAIPGRMKPIRYLLHIGFFLGLLYLCLNLFDFGHLLALIIL